MHTPNHVSFANVAGVQWPVKYKLILNPTSKILKWFINQNNNVWWYTVSFFVSPRTILGFLYVILWIIPFYLLLYIHRKCRISSLSLSLPPHPLVSLGGLNFVFDCFCLLLMLYIHLYCHSFPLLWIVCLCIIYELLAVKHFVLWLHYGLFVVPYPPQKKKLEACQDFFIWNFIFVLA